MFLAACFFVACGVYFSFNLFIYSLIYIKLDVAKRIFGFPVTSKLDWKTAPGPRAHVKFMMCAVYFGPG